MCSIKGHCSQMRSTNVLFLRSHISWADVNLFMRCCISEWCLCEAMSDTCPWIHGSSMPLCLCLCVRGLLNTCVNGWPQMCGHVRDFRCTSSCVGLCVQGWAVTQPCLLADVTVPAPLRGGECRGWWAEWAQKRTWDTTGAPEGAAMPDCGGCTGWDGAWLRPWGAITTGVCCGAITATAGARGPFWKSKEEMKR